MSALSRRQSFFDQLRAKERPGLPQRGEQNNIRVARSLGGDPWLVRGDRSRLRLLPWTVVFTACGLVWNEAPIPGPRTRVLELKNGFYSGLIQPFVGVTEVDADLQRALF